ncbi:MAG TPA: hypothetical protein VM934_17430 [Pyrinomonadaceae bacterium]|nr:hypothetical protein [Pyrinomonadaceae bacterium]
MTKKHYVLMIMLAFVAGAAGSRALPGGFPTASPVVEAKARAEDSDERKWEYCAITKAQYSGSVRGGMYWISYFRNGKVDVVDVEAGVTGNALAKAVFKLGEEGWEMVGEGPLEVRIGGPSSASNAIYFKRQKF